MKPIIFVVDPDGMVTAEEPLPLMSKHFQVEEEIEELTRETVLGNIPFVESCIRRVSCWGRCGLTRWRICCFGSMGVCL
jgi:phosphoserine phosphatase